MHTSSEVDFNPGRCTECIRRGVFCAAPFLCIADIVGYSGDILLFFFFFQNAIFQ